MGLDIIEIALDGLTDHKDFEKLASEIMHEEGYPRIRPLGGPSDEGQDAAQESYFLSEGRRRIVFQYTLQVYLHGKIEDTIDKLSKNKVEYDQLVIVTPHEIGTKQQINMTRDVRKKYDVDLVIYERRTLVNRLATDEKGIFNRHFPNIEKQLFDLTAKKPVLSDSKSSAFESSMLKSSLAFVFNRQASRLRKSIFDSMTLGLIIEDSKKGIPVDKLVEKFSRTVGARIPPKKQIEAAISRLSSGGLVKCSRDHVWPTSLAIETMAGSTIKSNEATNSLISDIIDDICQITEKRLSEDDKGLIARNSREVLVIFFRLSGCEIANHVLRNRPQALIYLDAYRELVKAAQYQLSQELGELLISVIAQKLKSPSEEQAQTLVNWSLAYLGIQIMNVDPELREFQSTRFRHKIFVLDTDFILDCLVAECPRSTPYRDLIAALRNLGCRIIIPDSCVRECVNHARLSPNTYHYFGPKLLSLNEAIVSEMVGNVFVKGFYYSCINKAPSNRTSFQKYLENYYEPASPILFLKNALKEIFPEGIEFTEPETLLKKAVEDAQMLPLRAEILTIMSISHKSSYRTEAEKRQLAETDARLFLATQNLNNTEDASTDNILGGSCYLITESSLYCRGAMKVGIQDVVSARPQSLMALLDLIGKFELTPTEFVSLYENPLLIHAVQRIWDDVQELLNSGIKLQDKSIPRLDWDLKRGLHKLIVDLKEADEKETVGEEEVDVEVGDSEYMELLKSAGSRGYKRIPELDFFVKAYESARDYGQAKSKALEEVLKHDEVLEKVITHFSKRKQRYLRRIARQRKGQ